MKYKYKIGMIARYDGILKAIIENENDVNVIFKFRLLGIRKSFESVIQNIDIIRNDLVTKYGKEDENKQISVKPDDKKNFENFVSEMNTFLDEEVEIDFDKIKASEAFGGGLKDSNYLVGLYDIMTQEGN